MQDTLEGRRASASEQSGGTSSDEVYRPILSLVETLHCGGVLLDYGAGVGEFTSQLLATGRFSRVEAADLMPRPKDIGHGVIWHAQDLNSALLVDASTYDVIVAAEVVEHLENPRATARDWFRLLRPGGWVVMSTPNNESVRALLHLALRGHFVHFSDSAYPAHITALLRIDLERVLREAGFECIAFQYSNRGGIPGRPRTTWQSMSFGRLRGRRWSDNILAYAQRPPE